MLEEQGHNNASGRLRNSFEPQIHLRTFEAVVGILIEDYGLDIDKRRKGEDLPPLFELYDDLLEWASYVRPDLPREDRDEWRLNVANRMKIEGSPTRGSFKFSRSGKRTGWIDETIDRSIDKIAIAVEDGRFVEIEIGKALNAI